MSHPYSIEINEPEDRDERDEFDNSDEEMEIKREREYEVAYIAESPEPEEEEDLVTRDRNELARTVRNEFDTTSKGIEGHDVRIQWIRIARSLDFYELAEEMTNDLSIGSI